jgi:hypothetical protein
MTTQTASAPPTLIMFKGELISFNLSKRNFQTVRAERTSTTA